MVTRNRPKYSFSENHVVALVDGGSKGAFQMIGVAGGLRPGAVEMSTIQTALKDQTRTSGENQLIKKRIIW